MLSKSRFTLGCFFIFQYFLVIWLLRNILFNLYSLTHIKLSFSGRDKQFIVKLPTAERVAWMWCILFAFCVPQLGALFRSVRMCYFKSSKRPLFSHFLIQFLAETGHTIGLAILFFHILPDIDVVKGAMLTNCLCFIPAILGKKRIS